MKIGFPLFFSLVLNCPLWAQQQPNPSLSAAEKSKIIATVSQLLLDNYVFPDKAEKMAAYLQQRHKARAYKSISSYKAFIDTLASDLRKTHLDLHMQLYYNPEAVARIRSWQQAGPQTPEVEQAHQAQLRRDNFGFVKVERLPGNIGYLDFRNFHEVNEASKNTVAAAMGFLGNADAIIIDMRQNGGGHPDMVQLVLSYFMDETPVHYNSLYERPTDQTQDYYTLAEVRGEKMPHTPLYILTSKRTFSAAEEFAYNLQNLKRATLIGETTGGGAHPTQPYIVNDQVAINIPFVRAINPFTKTNWEGTGVSPDVPVAATQALEEAQLLALKELATKASDPQRKAWLAWHQQPLLARLTPATPLSKEKLQRLAGSYGDRQIVLEGGTLYYQRAGRNKVKMTPLTENTFLLENLDYLRIQFVDDAAGRVEKLVALFDNGTTDEFARTH